MPIVIHRKRATIRGLEAQAQALRLRVNEIAPGCPRVKGDLVQIASLLAEIESRLAWCANEYPVMEEVECPEKN
jgi:hypothetical protein